MSTKKPTKTTTPTPTLKTPEREFENYIGLPPDEREEIDNYLFRAYDLANDNRIATRKFFESLRRAVSNYKVNHDALAFGLEIAALLNNTPEKIITRDDCICISLNALRKKLKEKHHFPEELKEVVDSDK